MMLYTGLAGTRKNGVPISGELMDAVRVCLGTETLKEVTNVHNQIVGSDKALCAAAESAARQQGYESVFLTDLLSCEAKEAGANLRELLKRQKMPIK